MFKECATEWLCKGFGQQSGVSEQRPLTREVPWMDTESLREQNRRGRGRGALRPRHG
jgi:hypothetical protein